MEIVGVGKTAKTVGLPDDKFRTADSVATTIENSSIDFDDFAWARPSIPSTTVKSLVAIGFSTARK